MDPAATEEGARSLCHVASSRSLGVFVEPRSNALTSAEVDGGHELVPEATMQAANGDAAQPMHLAAIHIFPRRPLDNTTSSYPTLVQVGSLNTMAKPLPQSKKRSLSPDCSSASSSFQRSYQNTQRVRFELPADPPTPRTRRRRTMVTQLYETFPSSQVLDDMLVDAAKLFNENYGTWGEESFKPGSPVRLSAGRLRKQYLPDNSQSSYTRVVVDGVLAGNAFFCRWNHAGKTVCWVTQLVVSKEYRERGLAGGLLRALKEDNDDIFGIMSSHPAACLAAAAAFATTIEKVSLDFIRKNAQGVMEVSPITYIRDAKLCGTIFEGLNRTRLRCQDWVLR